MKNPIDILCIRLLTFSLLWAWVTGQSLYAQECAYLPPGGPMRFGMHEVSRIDVTAQVGESPVWMDDGRIVAGAPLSSEAGYRRGAVYIFGPYSSRLVRDSVLLPPIPEIGAGNGGFGGQLATSGSWLAVRAKLTNNAVVLCMFQATNETGFAYRTNLVAVSGASNERLGDAERGFAMHGRWLAAIRYGNSNSRILMFRVNDEGIWEKKQELEHPQYNNSMPNDAKVDLFGDTLVWASANLGNASNSGRVDVWKMDGQGVWNYETRLIPEGYTTGNLGSGLDVAENRIFLGAPGFEHTESRGGAIFIFRRIHGEWKEESRITAAELATPPSIGRHVAYSDLTGEFLAEASNNQIRMFQPDPSGVGWRLVSRGTPGRLFEDWESPAGTIQDYSYGSTASTVLYLSVRAHQVLTGYRFLTALHEHGLHTVQTLHFSGDPECKRRPLYYVPIGAPRDHADKILGDMDTDGIPDLAEIYFGTFLDESNQLSNGLKAISPQGQQRIVEWTRYKDPELWVEARAEWSTDLVNWSTQGITVTKVGEDAAGREQMQASLPETTPTAYMRLVLTTSLP